jgi:hypothetical protein
MPIIESADSNNPRSVLRYRPIDRERGTSTKRTKKIKPEDVEEVPEVLTPIPRASRVEAAVHEHVHTEQERAHKHGSHVAFNPRRTRKIYDHDPRPVPLASRTKSWFTNLTKTQYYSLFFLALGMVVMLVLWTGGGVVNKWIVAWHDDLQFGYPRTYQTDAVVGHNDQNGVPSHFIAQNFHSRIIVIELPGGDASKSRVFIGPQLYGPNNANIPVTLTFMDVNHDHKPDMIISFQDMRLIYINTGTTFRPLEPSEQNQFGQSLKQIQ